mmetsp:Transcript_13785/g.20305  ORF Transcript_13785/g.20305 Transcript_13785/m.20305 type:complete len:269 (+) Transcript_13785:704-1510(+)
MVCDSRCSQHTPLAEGPLAKFCTENPVPRGLPRGQLREEVLVAEHVQGPGEGGPCVVAGLQGCDQEGILPRVLGVLPHCFVRKGGIGRGVARQDLQGQYVAFVDGVAYAPVEHWAVGWGGVLAHHVGPCRGGGQGGPQGPGLDHRVGVAAAHALAEVEVVNDLGPVLVPVNAAVRPELPHARAQAHPTRGQHIPSLVQEIHDHGGVQHPFILLPLGRKQHQVVPGPLPVYFQRNLPLRCPRQLEFQLVPSLFKSRKKERMGVLCLHGV